MNLIILWIYKKLTNQKSTSIKLCIACMIGSFGACMAVVFPGMNILLRFILLYVITSGGMIRIAFPYNGFWKFIKNIAWLYIVAFFVGGVIQYLYYNADIKGFIKDLKRNSLYQKLNIEFLMISILILLCVVWLCKRSLLEMRQNSRTIFPVQLTYGGETVEGKGLLDTGNRLRDPITHQPVTIVEYDLVQSLFSEEEQYYIKQFPEIEGISKIPIIIRAIPYHSVGNSCGMLPGVEFDQIRVGNQSNHYCKNQNSRVMIAIYPHIISSGKDYQMILHEECI